MRCINGLILLVCILGLQACDNMESGSKHNVQKTVAEKEKSLEILPGIDSDQVENHLSKYPISSVRYILKKNETRTEFIRGMFANKKLKEIVGTKKIDQDKAIKLKIETAKNTIYIDALVEDYFNERAKDLAILAKDKYDLNKEDYILRRKIMISQIYLSKINRSLEDTKKILQEIMSELEKKGDFSKLADQYSEDKEFSRKGGAYDKWIIEPSKGKKLNKIIAAAFKLNKVGSITEVIESSQGFHIIKLVRDSPELQLPFSEVKKNIINELKKELLSTAKAEVKKSLYPAEGINHNDKVLRSILESAIEQKSSSVKNSSND